HEGRQVWEWRNPTGFWQSTPRLNQTEDPSLPPSMTAHPRSIGKGRVRSWVDARALSRSEMLFLASPLWRHQPRLFRGMLLPLRAPSEGVTRQSGNASLLAHAPF